MAKNKYPEYTLPSGSVLAMRPYTFRDVIEAKAEAMEAGRLQELNSYLLEKVATIDRERLTVDAVGELAGDDHLSILQLLEVYTPYTPTDEEKTAHPESKWLPDGSRYIIKKWLAKHTVTAGDRAGQDGFMVTPHLISLLVLVDDQELSIEQVLDMPGRHGIMISERFDRVPLPTAVK